MNKKFLNKFKLKFVDFLNSKKNYFVKKKKTKNLNLLKLILNSFLSLIFFTAFTSLTNFLILKKEKQKYKVPGRLLTLNSQKIHVYCQGHGQPVLLIHGLDSFSINLSAISNLLVKRNFQAVSMDRPGYGWSQKIKEPLSMLESAEMIKSLLDSLKIEKPIILFGHSLGSWNVRMFAHLYPEKVKAIVLSDPLEELNFLQVSQTTKNVYYNFLAYLFFRKYLVSLGLYRILNLFQIDASLTDFKVTSLSDEEKDICNYYFHNYQNSTTALAEYQKVESYAREMLLTRTQFNQSLQNKPLVIVSAKSLWLGKNLPPGLSQQDLDLIDEIRIEMHKNLLTLSDYSWQVLAEKSDHFALPLLEPEIIVQQIVKVSNFEKK